MSLPSSGRQLSVSPLVLLEREGCGSVGDGGLEVRVRDPFSQCSASLRITHRPEFLFFPFHQGESYGGDSGSVSQRVRSSLSP